MVCLQIEIPEFCEFKIEVLHGNQEQRDMYARARRRVMDFGWVAAKSNMNRYMNMRELWVSRIEVSPLRQMYAHAHLGVRLDEIKQSCANSTRG